MLLVDEATSGREVRERSFFVLSFSLALDSESFCRPGDCWSESSIAIIQMTLKQSLVF